MTNQALPDLQRVCVGVTGCNIIRETRNGDDTYVREEDEMIRSCSSVVLLGLLIKSDLQRAQVDASGPARPEAF